MTEIPKTISDVDELDDILSTPPEEVIEQFKQLEGDILVLGAGGKIGPSLARMAKRASENAGVSRRVFGVSRFTSQSAREHLEKNGVETIAGDLLDQRFFAQLPDATNVLYLAALKFGASTNKPLLWAKNVKLSALVADRYRHSKIVAYSSGNVYPYVATESGGCTESDAPDPVGEYAQSVLGRERMFEYTSQEHGTAVTFVRLNYAVEMRYGVLVDIGLKVKRGIPIDLRNGHVNVIWQGDNNSITLRCLGLCASPPKILNVTGPDITSVRETADTFGRLLGVEPRFKNRESGTALLSNAALATRLFGSPSVSVEQMIFWITDWLRGERPLLEKPTEFEVTDGKY